MDRENLRAPTCFSVRPLHHRPISVGSSSDHTSDSLLYIHTGKHMIWHLVCCFPVNKSGKSVERSVLLELPARPLPVSLIVSIQFSLPPKKSGKKSIGSSFSSSQETGWAKGEMQLVVEPQPCGCGIRVWLAARHATFTPPPSLPTSLPVPCTGADHSRDTKTMPAMDRGTFPPPLHRGGRGGGWVVGLAGVCTRSAQSWP